MPCSTQRQTLFIHPKPSVFTFCFHFPLFLLFNTLKLLLGDSNFYAFYAPLEPVAPNGQYLVARCNAILTIVVPLVVWIASYTVEGMSKENKLLALKRSSDAKTAFINYLTDETRNSLKWSW